MYLTNTMTTVHASLPHTKRNNNLPKLHKQLLVLLPKQQSLQH